MLTICITIVGWYLTFHLHWGTYFCDTLTLCSAPTDPQKHQQISFAQIINIVKISISYIIYNHGTTA